ncbi:MAG: Uma2 family endonuclease [Betaproteobacteria bacterium]|nr:Uma2 family endonuclease [Candidatus Dechloromonas phosphorivorans]
MALLSPSTEKTDRREKWIAYRQLDSLQEYALVDQGAAVGLRYFAATRRAGCRKLRRLENRSA